jgi:hypothetical protein
MKKLLTAKSLSLLMLLSLFSGKAEAGRNYEDGYVSESRDCCFSSCYECGCNPLYCGAWDLQIQAGVQPITWRNRGDVLGVSCAASATTPVIALFETPKFKTLHKTPWVVGGQIGYHWSDNVRAYVEFNYSQAKAKDAVAITTAGVPTLLVDLTLSKYKVFDAYVGTRYYWDRWCDRVAFFLGAKVGLTHHKSQDVLIAASITTPAALSTSFTFPAFNSNNVVSGGADFGLDVCFCGNWSFVITGAVLASCGPRAARVHVADITAPVLGITDIVVGGIGSELRFPVTAGIRYSF